MRFTKKVKVVLSAAGAVLFMVLTACGAESAPQPASTAQATPSPTAQPATSVAPAPTATATPLPEPPTPSPTSQPTDTPTAPTAAEGTPAPTLVPSTRTAPETPIEPPADTRTVLADRVEGLDGGVASLRFFESPGPTTPQADRVYRTRFGPDTARHIAWEIGLAYSAPGEASGVKTESVIQDASGSVVARTDSDRTLRASGTNSFHVSKSGGGSAGFWAPGWYSATVSIGGEEAAKGWFQVAAPPTAESSTMVRDLTVGLTQLETPQRQTDRRLVEALFRLWDAAPGLAREVESFPWTADGVTNFELGALEHLAEIAMAAGAAAEAARSWEWLAARITQDEWDALRDLAVLGQASPESLSATAAHPWLADNLGEDELAVLGYLAALARPTEEPTPVAPASWPWVADGITTNERWALSALSRLASVDPDLAGVALAFPWISDDMQEGERRALRGISAMTDASTALARRAASYSWLADGITEAEWWTLNYLASLSESRAALASQVADYAWLDDGLSEDERWAVWSLAEIAGKDGDLAANLAGMAFMGPPFRSRDFRALFSVWRLMDRTKEWGLISSQEWFADGLNDEDAAFMATLDDLSRREPYSQFSGLVESHFTRTSVVGLPLAGDVELIAFRRTPFQQFDDIIRQVENALRASESFMGVPFPKKDVILLFTDKLYSGPAINDVILAYNVGTHMLVTRPELIEGDYRSAVAHEVAHFYWHTNNAPLWFREGGSEFLASYILDWSGLRPLEDRKTPLWSNEVQGICAGRGVPNVQKLITLLEEQGYAAHAESTQFLCNYIVGEYLLLELYDAVGEEGASAAWGELYLLAEAEARAPTEQEIFEAFSRNTPSGQEETFLSVYRQWHGGPAGE